MTAPNNPMPTLPPGATPTVVGSIRQAARATDIDFGLLGFASVCGRAALGSSAFATERGGETEANRDSTGTGGSRSGKGSTGWTAGAGIEGRIGGNWTAKLEYLYMDLGTASAGPIATTILGPVRPPVGASYSSHFTDNILRVGFNYIFNAPVAAKY